MKTKCLLSFLFITCFLLDQPLAQWNAFDPQGPPDHFVLSLSAVDENTAWGALADFNFVGSKQFVKTTDGGESWTVGTIEGATDGFTTWHIFSLDKNTAWVSRIRQVTFQEIQTEILKTTDGGISWTLQTLPASYENFANVAVHFFNENEGTAFAEVNNGTGWYVEAFFTDDGGDSWQLAQTPDSLNERIWILVGNHHYEVLEDKIWFGTSQGRIYRSEDRGKNWEAIHTGLEDRTINSLSFKDELHGIAVSVWDGQNPPGAAPNAAVRTSDGGKTWTQSPIPATPVAASIEYVPGSGGVYILNFAAFAPGAYISMDNGNNWKLISDDRIDVIQFLSPGVGWAGGEKMGGGGPGMYKWTGGDQLFDETLINVRTFSGSGIEGTLNGDAGKAKFWNSKGMDMDRQGNVYVADDYNNTIRLITADGKVSTFAGQDAVSGYENGPATEALFSRPQDVAVDNQGNVYVADPGNACIRMIGTDGLVSLYAGVPGQFGGNDGALLEAKFDWPNSLGIDASDNLYVADGNGIRKIDTEGTVSTILNTANFIWGLDADAEGNVYFADFDASAIKRLTTEGVVETLAGGFGCQDGQSGKFSFPEDVAVDAWGNVYVADGTNQRIRKVTPDGDVITLAGDGCLGGFATENKIVDGAGELAQFGRLRGILLKPDGNLLVNSWDNDALREIQIGHQPLPITVLESTHSAKYPTIPLSQVEPVTFESAVINSSDEEVTGVKMIVRISKDGQTIYNKTSSVLTLAGGAIEVLAIEDAFMPQETGRYEIEYLFRGDNLDVFLVRSDELTISDSLLAVDDGHQYFYHSADFNPTAYASFGQTYELTAGDSLQGISARIIAENASIVFGVYPIEGTQIGDPVYLSDTLTGVSNAFPGDYYYSLPSPAFIDAGKYLFTLERYNSDGFLRMGVDSDVNDNSAWFKQPVSGWMDWTPYRIFWQESTAPVFMLRPVLKSPALTPATEAVEEPFAVQLSPNPATDFLQVSIEQRIHPWYNVQLYDLQGQLLSSTILSGRSTADFNLKGIPPGIYLVKVFNEHGVVTRKVIRQ